MKVNTAEAAGMQKDKGLQLNAEYLRYSIAEEDCRRVTFKLNNTKNILILKDLQELLHIGKNTALRLVQSGESEALRVGNQWRIPCEAIIKYIGGNSIY